MSEIPAFRHTTVLAVRRDGAVALGSDGQVTLGTTILKQGASKIRRLAGGTVLAGFAGSTADAVALFTRFERKLEEFGGQLERAAIELATDWRTEKTLRTLEALLVVADREHVLVLSGAGDVIEPDAAAGGGAVAIGSGGPYALAAARALLAHSSLSARQVADVAMKSAAAICIYTNANITVEEL